MTARSSLLLLVALGASVVGCGQKRAQPAPAAATPLTTATPTDEDPIAAAVNEKRPRFGSSAIYVDGKAIGVLTSTELPSTLKARIVDEEAQYGLIDTLRAFNVDMKKVRGLHLYGGERVITLGKEDLVNAEKIRFYFVGTSKGKAHLTLPFRLPKGNYTFDMLTNVAVYIDKEPPHRNAERELVMPDGSLVGKKVPYAPEEQGSGTRLYVDGALVGTVKRKKITNDLIVAPSANDGVVDGANAKLLPAAAAADTTDRFTLLGYAAKFNANANQVKTADLVAGDDVIAHLSAAELRTLTFNVPARNRGQAVVYLPQDGKLRPARVSAVQIYFNSSPPNRPVVPLDEAREARVGSSQQGSDSANEL